MEFRARVRQTLIDMENREAQYKDQLKAQVKGSDLPKLKLAWEVKVSKAFPALKEWVFERKATLMAGLLVSDDSIQMMKAKERILELDEVMEEIENYGNLYVEKMQETVQEHLGKEIGDTISQDGEGN